MSGVTYLSYLNAQKSVVSADNISRMRLVLKAMGEIDIQDAALEVNTHKYLSTGEKKYSDSCKTLPDLILYEVSNIRIFGISDSGIRNNLVLLEKEVGRQEQVVNKVLDLSRDSLEKARQILNSDSVSEAFYRVKTEINKARENEGFLFAMQITVKQ